MLYLHHGITVDQTTWTNQSKGRAHHIMDNLYAQNKAVPMVIVMVDGAMGDQGDFNAFAKFEDVLLQDLIPHIEAAYSVSTDPLERAIGGLSMADLRPGQHPHPIEWAPGRGDGVGCSTPPPSAWTVAHSNKPPCRFGGY